MEDAMDIDMDDVSEDNRSEISYQSLTSKMTTSSQKSRQIPSNGNYRGYYKFREKQMVDNITRISGFQSSWFYEQRVLDIGCNDGTLTIMIAKDYNPMSVIGIDVDQRLIDAAGSAVKRAKYEYRSKKKSDRVPLDSIPETSEASPMNKQFHGLVPRQVAKVRPLYPGHIVTNSPTDDNGGKYPFNVFFRCEDIMESTKKPEEYGYGVILCMSVAKWVHLNHGDEGLMRFFHLLFAMATPGGKVIVEYQPWKSYINNKAASEVIKCNFKQIKIRPDDFERILSEEIGFTIISRLGTSLDKAKGFQRPIVVLMKPLPQLARISQHIARVNDATSSSSTSTTNESNQHMEDMMMQEEMPIVNAASSAAISSDNTTTITTDIFGVKRRMSRSESSELSYQPDHENSPSYISAQKRFRIGLQ
jgi:7SK snRNA methylphosphate capping enzyme